MGSRAILLFSIFYSNVQNLALVFTAIGFNFILPLSQQRQFQSQADKNSARNAIHPYPDFAVRSYFGRKAGSENCQYKAPNGTGNDKNKTEDQIRRWVMDIIGLNELGQKNQEK
jgi:hypothetical protein